MFTGIIREIGKVKKVEKHQNSALFEIITTKILQDKKIGESIAINGVCLTITKIEQNTFSCEAVEETLNKTNLGELKENDEVNLEPALKLNESLDGHLVQGHVDSTGIIQLVEKQKNQTKISISLAKEISQYLAFKGSITINGVSLTISDLQEDNFTVTLISHTLENTNLGKIKKNDKVNLEVDVVARYIERMLNKKENQVTYAFLKERNLI